MDTLLSNTIRLTLAGLLVLASCSDEQADVLLVVKASQQQPSRDDLGVIG
ncbi:MAG: hypothetical protein ABW061_25420 [Polyangiaceae bacterium]